MTTRLAADGILWLCAAPLATGRWGSCHRGYRTQ